MKVTLKSDSSVSVNDIEIVLGKGTEVELPCQSAQEALEMCAITKLNVDFSYKEDGKEYIAGAAGKFIEMPETPKVVAPKKAKEVAEPKKAKEEPKAKAKK